MKGTPIKSQSRHPKIRAFRTEENLAKWLKTEYDDKGRFCADIAEEIGCSAPHVWTFLKKFRIPIKTASEAHKGKHLSPEAKQKLREARKGKHHSPETKRKIGEAKKGKHLSPGHKRKIGEAKKGKHISEKHKQKLREANSGENNPNWKDGKSNEPYPLEWNERLKEQIRDRDDRLCQMPGCYLSENGKKHTVHHIDYDKKNIDLFNLITLCHSHNLKVNSNRAYWTEFFQELQTMRRLNYKTCSLSETIIV